MLRRDVIRATNKINYKLGLRARGHCIVYHRKINFHSYTELN